ncbi:MAG: aconitate hydratase AcnA [Kofleriaceae bacterium]|nr:aconitate hydratase AcnA [Myxococcales bacterium]MCB9572467.1 aconitate hydratase AcnA [Kofleriaceae bacterium]
MSSLNSFQSKARITVGGRTVEIYRLDALAKAGVGDVATLPYSLRILLENLLRHEDGKTVGKDDIAAVAGWDPQAKSQHEIQLRPARVLMQDFTGVPAVVDLAAMRDAFAAMGLDPTALNPIRRADLVIDHSVQVDVYGSPVAFGKNVDLEYGRNRERYLFLKWGQQAFANMTVVPPGTGICHQVNIEYLAKVVWSEEIDGVTVAYPDSLVGTDSHTTMVNGLSVLGWGVGGIEAEAVMLGQPMAMLIPDVVGFELRGKLPAGTTATDLVLTVTEMLRQKKVVGKFVEFYGDGLDGLSLPDRATIANMAPEYGATMGFFPIDAETIAYLRFTGRADDQVELVERYAKENGLWRDPSAKLRYSDTLSLDLGTVVPSLAGPKRPQDRVPLSTSKTAWRKTLPAILGPKANVDAAAAAAWADGTGEATGPLAASREVTTDHGTFTVGQGTVVIAAITSCTNTSNPAVLLAAGLLARKAAAKGLRAKPWVKTSLAPGSQVVTDYLIDAGLMTDLETLGFNLVGYGCTTCIGNSGPIHEAIAGAIKEADLVATSVLSGNRNFEGRVNPSVRANYLASPPLVVAYAIAGTMDIDLATEPLGTGADGKPVFLKDVWPSATEVTDAIRNHVRRDQFVERYAHVLDGDDAWRELAAPTSDTYAWDDASTYIRRPSFFEDLGPEPTPMTDLAGARCLALLGDSVTTDHISPAGNIAKDGPAARYLGEHGVQPRDFNQFGARRGNHEVMMRGTFANIRLKNLLAPGTEGGVTRHLPDGTQMSIYDAAMKYQADGVPLVVLAGAEYGTGSSRDWAAKGTLLLGVKVVIAKSYERIHRSNLIGMGVLPLEFEPGQDAASLGLTGEEEFAIEGISAGLSPRKQLTVKAGAKTFTAIARVDTPQEVEYLAHGGILQYVLRHRAAALRGA